MIFLEGSAEEISRETSGAFPEKVLDEIMSECLGEIPEETPGKFSREISQKFWNILEVPSANLFFRSFS